MKVALNANSRLSLSHGRHAACTPDGMQHVFLMACGTQHARFTTAESTAQCGSWGLDVRVGTDLESHRRTKPRWPAVMKRWRCSMASCCPTCPATIHPLPTASPPSGAHQNQKFLLFAALSSMCDLPAVSHRARESGCDRHSCCAAN